MPLPCSGQLAAKSCRRSVASLDQVVGDLLDRIGGLTGLKGASVGGNDDRLAGLHHHATTIRRLPVEAAIAGHHHHVFFSCPPTDRWCGYPWDP